MTFSWRTSQYENIRSVIKLSDVFSKIYITYQYLLRYVLKSHEKVSNKTLEQVISDSVLNSWYVNFVIISSLLIFIILWDACSHNNMTNIYDWIHSASLYKYSILWFIISLFLYCSFLSYSLPTGFPLVVPVWAKFKYIY